MAIRFVLTSEISSIYTQDGKARRIHNLIIAPNLATVEKINSQLRKQGANLNSDGRPIVGLSSKEIAGLVFSANPNCLLIPCHVWTPWFSLYGSKSGFDSIDECFGEFSRQILSIETGLSSDPGMNWQIKELENKQIVSFSDAHSPSKIGREATVFVSQDKDGLSFSYQDLVSALKTLPQTNWQIGKTVEFYPEEGKYHYSGHRKCQICYSPQEVKEKGALCPVCGRSLTLGVTFQVEKLSTVKVIPQTKEINGLVFQSNPQKKRPPYVTLIPLLEIIAQVENRGVNTKGVGEIYQQMIVQLGNEFNILLKTRLEKISSLFGQRISKAIEKVRKRQITIKPGFDGVFGEVKIWQEQEEQKAKEEQMILF